MLEVEKVGGETCAAVVLSFVADAATLLPSVAPGCACVFGAPERSGLCFFSRHVIPSDGYLSASHEKQY